MRAQSRVRSTGRTGLVLVCLALLGVFLSCSDCEESPIEPASTQEDASADAQTPPKTWPEGAVLAVNGRPIFEDEVDRVAAWIQFLHPENTLPSLRRQALTTLLLDRTNMAVRFAERRTKAESAAKASLAKLRAGKANDTGETVTGDWSDLGLGIWGETRALTQGTWSGPFELVGRWVLLRKDASMPGQVPIADQFTVTILDFTYTPPEFTREDFAAAPRAAQLSIIHPDWEALVPSAWGQKLPDRWYEGR